MRHQGVADLPKRPPSDRCPDSRTDEQRVIKSSLAGIDAKELWICKKSSMIY